MPKLSQKQIKDIATVIRGELELLEAGEVYIWKHKESRDRGMSWIPTSRITVYHNMLAVLEGNTQPVKDVEPDVVEEAPEPEESQGDTEA